LVLVVLVLGMGSRLEDMGSHLVHMSSHLVRMGSHPVHMGSHPLAPWMGMVHRRCMDTGGINHMGMRPMVHRFICMGVGIWIDLDMEVVKEVGGGVAVHLCILRCPNGLLGCLRSQLLRWGVEWAGMRRTMREVGTGAEAEIGEGMAVVLAAVVGGRVEGYRTHEQLVRLVCLAILHSILLPCRGCSSSLL